MAIQDDLPRSRITLTYRTTISGQPETVDLPFRVLMMGDFSRGTSVDRQLDLEGRKPRALNGKNLDDLMKDMKMSLKFTVPNRINPDVAPDLEVELPIERMKSFHPDAIVQHVPKMKALLLLRKLISEMQSSVDNRKDLRLALNELFKDPAALKLMLDELKAYQTLKLPAPADAGSTTAGAGGTTGSGGTPGAGGNAGAGGSAAKGGGTPAKTP